MLKWIYQEASKDLGNDVSEVYLADKQYHISCSGNNDVMLNCSWAYMLLSSSTSTGARGIQRSKFAHTPRMR